MHYTLLNIRHEPHDLDDEIIYFYFEVVYQSTPSLTITYFCSLSNVLDYIEVQQPAFYAFWEHTRKGLELWGPAQQSTINAIGDEAIGQLYDYLVAYYRSNDHLEQEYERLRANAERPIEQQIADHEKLEAMMKMLDLKHFNIKDEQKRYREFCKKAEIQLREIALEVYPELADMESEQLRAFKGVFTSDTMNIHASLEKLLNG